MQTETMRMKVGPMGSGRQKVTQDLATGVGYVNTSGGGKIPSFDQMMINLAFSIISPSR